MKFDRIKINENAMTQTQDVGKALYLEAECTKTKHDSVTILLNAVHHTHTYALKIKRTVKREILRFELSIADAKKH